MSNPILQLPNGFNVGTDVSGTIADNTGVVRNWADFGHMTEVEARGAQHDIKIIPITRGGRPLFQTLWAGGNGHVKFTRVFGAVTYMWSALMNNYYYLHQLPSFQLLFTILNRDGSIDEYLFSGAVLTSPTWGTARGDKEVDQEIHFNFQNCQIVSPNAPALGASPLSFT